MPFEAIKASYREETASWDPNAKQYQLLEDGQPAGVVSTKAQAERFVTTSNKQDRHIRHTLQGKPTRPY
tara:strand:+ start:267 stop:473 length:207 start_codon:yes stop_codon:yes gene_type:complete